MAQIVTCLKRVGENIKKYRLIPFGENTEVTIGRSVDATACLLSTMISRHHAIFKKQKDGTWTVQDNKSLNGVYVNGEKLKSQEAAALADGDRVPTPQQSSFFSFFSALKIKRQRPRSTDEPDGNPMKPAKRSKLLMDDVTNLSRSDTEQSEAMSEEANKASSQPQASDRLKSESWSPFKQYRSKLHQEEKEAQEKVKNLEARMAELQKLLEQKDTAQEEMRHELERREKQTKEMRDREEDLKKELNRKKVSIHGHTCEAEEKLREQLDLELKERERRLREQLQTQRDTLLHEKLKVEEILQKQMETALEEKDRRLEEELIRQKQRLESVLAKKDLEQKLLETQLNETKAEKDKLEETTLRAREDVLTNFADLMEMELQCSICNELFVQATTLNCSHGFCALCIKQWMKRKKACPICRAGITTYMRSIVLDSYIDKMLDNLSDDMKEKRKELIDLRKAEQAKFDAENQPTTSGTSTSTVTVRGRGRGGGRARGRGRGRGRGGVMAAPSPPLPESEPIIVNDAEPIVVNDAEPIVVSEGSDNLSDLDSGDDSDSDSESYSGSYGIHSDEDEVDYVYGERGAYFGGYGRCYSCGSRGHWANGCPYR
ncbi:hypothetical protein ScPMuIL_013951 [Solemya velum]